MTWEQKVRDRGSKAGREIRILALQACAVAVLSGTMVFSRMPDASPDESGKAMILEYHLIQSNETRWGRSIANFKRDLQ